jgi:hypothetical protein
MAKPNPAFAVALDKLCNNLCVKIDRRDVIKHLMSGSRILCNGEPLTMDNLIPVLACQNLLPTIVIKLWHYNSDAWPKILDALSDDCVSAYFSEFVSTLKDKPSQSLEVPEMREFLKNCL